MRLSKVISALAILVGLRIPFRTDKIRSHNWEALPAKDRRGLLRFWIVCYSLGGLLEYRI